MVPSATTHASATRVRFVVPTSPAGDIPFLYVKLMFYAQLRLLQRPSDMTVKLTDESTYPSTSDASENIDDNNKPYEKYERNRSLAYAVIVFTFHSGKTLTGHTRLLLHQRPLLLGRLFLGRIVFHPYIYFFFLEISTHKYIIWCQSKEGCLADIDGGHKSALCPPTRLVDNSSLVVHLNSYSQKN